MQAMDRDDGRTQLSVSVATKQRMLSRKKEHQTYDEVLKFLLDTIEVGDDGNEYGVIFLHTIPVDGEMKKLRSPLPLILNIAENGYIQLANTEYSILVSLPTLKEAVDEAQRQFADGLVFFNNPDLHLSPAARERGKHFRDAVVM
ncbi:hypothetical protein [Methanorbis rubei]|uniref:Uncharacterized protein n=1 Tax=Methanorbis rubei TaxID=3028300 RepID=A0AAE4SC39_9EURY|nr:hypothetical protein [Methanocorpusculaceae archaeon Cs1]